ncbi:hypothetical protein JWG44_13900 [Leptospira sp. 201903071]|uniref:laminin/fibronectin-binding adhesin Lsa30 n=1 Tax=Leptospira ainazelensis TaxID=2810034 RepID=UPI0019668021|nr:hypothetical protein [Leptospira ainazelensis]MBM9501346.1 hypothetical protein [Leptospira ainazelensis]
MRNTAILFSFFCATLFFGSCTFGSVGNSKEEEAKMIQKLLTLFSQRTSSFQTGIYFTDDQQDVNIGTFSLVSGGTTYNLQLLAGSKIVWDGVAIRVNPNPVPTIPNQSSSIDKNEHSAQSHTPYTVPLDLPVSSPYGADYGTPSFTDSSLEVANGSILTGDVHSSVVPPIQGIPSGYLASVKYKIQSLDLSFQITAPGINTTVRIQLAPFVVELFPRCRFDIVPEKLGNFPVTWNLTGILQDQAGISLLGTVPAAGTFNINPYQNVNLYNLILTNFQQQDRVLYQTGCSVF